MEETVYKLICRALDEQLPRILADLGLVADAIGHAHPDEWLSPSRSAEIAETTPATVRRWVREGVLPGGHAGRSVRIKRSDLEAFLRRGPASKLTAAGAVARVLGGVK